MSSHRDMDRLLGDFFREGPSSLPAEVHRAVLAQVATTRQRGHWTAWARGHRAGLPIAVWAAVMAGIVVVMVAIIGLARLGPPASPAPAVGALPPTGAAHPGGAPSPGPSRAAPTTYLVTTTVPTSWSSFRSSRFGYALRHPPGFLTSEVPGSPTTGSLLNAQGTDQFNGPGIAQVGVVRLALAADASLATWRAQAAPRDAACANPERQASVTIAAEAGLVDVDHCLGRYVLVAYVLHRGYGFEVYWSSPGGNETADLATFLQLLGSVQFAS